MFWCLCFRVKHVEMRIFFCQNVILSSALFLFMSLCSTYIQHNIFFSMQFYAAGFYNAFVQSSNTFLCPFCTNILDLLLADTHLLFNKPLFCNMPILMPIAIIILNNNLTRKVHFCFFSQKERVSRKYLCKSNFSSSMFNVKI